MKKVFQDKYHVRRDVYLAKLLVHLKICLTIKVCLFAVVVTALTRTVFIALMLILNFVTFGADYYGG